jgi:hypothetical protein
MVLVRRSYAFGERHRDGCRGLEHVVRRFAIRERVYLRFGLAKQ